MNIFLKQQKVKKDDRRRKVLRSLFVKVQRISMIVLIWLLVVGGIYFLYQLVFERGLFVVKNIEVDGTLVRLTADKIKDLSGVKIGSNLFGVDLKKVQKQVSQNPWVNEVAVTRKLPGTIWIYVGEFTPFALLGSDSLYLVDSEGKVFKELEARDEKDYPLITGLAKGEELNDAVALLKTFISSPLADYFIPAEVNIDKLRGNSIVLAGDGVVIRLGFGDIPDKLQRLYSMLGALTLNKGKMRYVDLNIPGKVVVKYGS